MSSPRVRREDLKPGEVLCSYCTAKCCRYYAFPIEKPKEFRDYEHIRWFMMHGRAAIFAEDGTWYLMVFADCKHLQEDHRCGNYEHRPEICREYSTDNCEYEGDGTYDLYFETSEQFWEYTQAMFPEKFLRQFSTSPVDPREVPLPLAAS